MFRCKARKNRIARRILTYVERCGLQRNPDSIGTDEHFVKAFGFYRQGILPFINAHPYRDAHPVNSPLIHLDDQILFLPFPHSQFIAVFKIGNSNFLINGLYLPVTNVDSALFD